MLNTIPWEQCKLGDVVNIIMGQSPDSKNYTNNSSDHILVQGNADIKNGFVYPRVWTTQITKQSHSGDLIMSVRAPVGDIAKTEYDVVLGRGVCAIKGNEFIFQLLTKMKENDYWESLSTGSTFDSINSNDIKNAEIFIPSLEEQTQIGNFFKQLDDTIALHQREFEKFKILRKAYLKHIFIDNTTQFRAEKTIPWEQCKLGDVVNIIMGQSPDSKNYTNNSSDHILVQGNADIKNGFVYPRVWTTQITKQSHSGDLIMSVRAPVGDIAKTEYDVVLGRGVCAIKGNEFIFQLLTKMKENDYWESLSTGSTFDSINSNDIKNAEIFIPSLEEQTQIGNFFKQLDDTIALHQKELAKYQQIKTACLEKMFVE